jgi:hypothetical protein
LIFRPKVSTIVWQILNIVRTFSWPEHQVHHVMARGQSVNWNILMFIHIFSCCTKIVKLWTVKVWLSWQKCLSKIDKHLRFTAGLSTIFPFIVLQWLPSHIELIILIMIIIKPIKINNIRWTHRPGVLAGALMNLHSFLEKLTMFARCFS